jgi:hypothetical protein
VVDQGHDEQGGFPAVADPPVSMDDRMPLAGLSGSFAKRALRVSIFVVVALIVVIWLVLDEQP